MAPRPLDSIRPAFRTVARAVVPGSQSFDAEEWAAAEAIVDDALRARPPAVRRQIRLFVKALGVLALLRHRRSLGRLDPERTRLLLAELEHSSLLAVRRGVWGLRTLAYMGCYGRAPARASLGYRAAAAGWSGRGGGAGTWPERAGLGGPEPVVHAMLEGSPPDA